MLCSLMLNSIKLVCQISPTYFHFLYLSTSTVQHKAKNIYDQIHSRTIHGKLHEALSLFYTHNIVFGSSLTLCGKTYATLFHACARHKYLQEGTTLHQYLLERHPTIKNDLFVANHIVNMYCKCGQMVDAHYVFDQMPRRNIVSWTALISGYAQYGRVRECFRVFSGLMEQFCPNEFAFASLLSACCEEHDIDCGRQVHALALKICLDTNAYVGNSLITMYCKCSGHCGVFDHRTDEGWTIFKSMDFRNLISWNSMIAGFQSRGLGDQAIRLFTEMYRHGIGFDRATLLSVLSSLSGCNNAEDIGVYLWHCFQLHCLTIRSGIILEVEVRTALLKSYANLGGCNSDCYRLFSEASSYQDIVLWTAMITVFAEQDPEQAFLLFCQMHRNDFVLDWHAFSIVLKACATFVTEQHALAIHSQVIKRGFHDDTVISNALIHAYARCGSLALSAQVFDEMDIHDLVSWNSMLKSYALHGKAREALQLFQRMNVNPDSATFVALLSACSHAGLVEEGVKIFNSMAQNYGYDPQLDHYACMVDLFGRAGRMVEAKDLIHKMPMKPDAVIWSALLGSCRKHGEAQLAKFAVDKLTELDPKSSLGYVQMSNIYFSTGSFNEANLIRKEMRGSMVIKEPGLSWIEIGKKVHEFSSRGQRHPQRELILNRLEIMIGQLKEKGYVPETSFALYDTEEENKEEQLFHHSEKMALVFAILNEGSLPFGGNVIKIIKNIRICVDCHNFMKLVSGTYQKEIIVRDSNRFHHFKDARCSCNDYW